MTSIFIASSTEGRRYAEIAASILASNGASPHPWWSERSFPVGRTLIESLTEILDTVDAALIVATPDDQTARRGNMTYMAAQNVILEYGLFAGRLGTLGTAILEIGTPALPSDLDGLSNMRIRPLADDEDTTFYRDLEVKPKLLSWLESIDANSGNGFRLARLVDRLAPQLRQPDRIDLKANILRAQLDPQALPKQTTASLEYLLLKYTSYDEMGAPVGYDHRSALDSYVNLADVPADSEDERRLAGHFARYLAENCTSQDIRPTLLAISKTATQGILNAATRLLPYPVVLVSPTGPSRKRPVEGYCEPGDRAILVHDVTLSGHHLVDCVVALRSVGIECKNLVTLNRHQTGSRDLSVLMRENSIDVKAASVFIPNLRRVICGDFSLGSSQEAPPECVLCKVVAKNDNTPVRAFITSDELPTEILMQEEHFSAISDVAPLSPGHTLLVSKQHVLAMSKLSPQLLTELDLFRQELTAQLQTIYSLPVVAFEHGLCNRARTPGCGIDHAHLHLLPTDIDVSRLFKEDFETAALDRIEELNEATKGRQEYLLLIDADRRISISSPNLPTSQYFRRKIAQALGRELWNWNDEVILGVASQRKDWIITLHKAWGQHPEGQ
jgi:diadenosine tetraphosphate (Ap4A) HIT family hydrolase